MATLSLCFGPETGLNGIGASLVDFYDFNIGCHDKVNVNGPDHNDGECI